MNIFDKKTEELIPYINNPRNNDEAVDKVAASISEFGFKVPIVITSDNVIVTGHTRLKAAKKLGLATVPCIIADDLTEAQIKAFRLADNKVSEFSTWDFEKLEIELDGLADLNMDDFGFEIDVDTDLVPVEKEQHANLSEEFIVPPFSVLDTKQGYWRERKKAWLSLGLRSGEGRDEGLLTDGIKDLEKIKGMETQKGTSIFDPVLCEIMYRWFNLEGGAIYDCFAGGSVRGIVAGYLGYKYTGIELRQEQVNENINQLERFDIDNAPLWICDDSRNVDKYVGDNSVDLLFSCPPYGDLEVYSDDERDISNMEYDDFLKAYGEIISKAIKKLKNDRFAVFTVGDIRDKKGYYRGFTDDTKRIFRENGMPLYNEFILADPIGTAMLRAKGYFNAGRKVAKVHQNVLVFYKGDIKQIKENFREVINTDLSEFEAE